MKLPAYPHYKPSGVEWLGHVPEHWTRKRFGYLFRFFSGGTPSTDDGAFWDGDLPWVSSKDMKSMLISDTEDHISEDAVRQSATCKIPAGSLLMVNRSGILRHSIPTAITTREMAINQDIRGCVPSSEVDARFIAYLIAGNQKPLLTLWRQQGATVESLGFESVKATNILLPPLPEQQAIAAFLDRETGRVDLLVAKKRELIERLKEKRTALISRTVTRGLPPAAARAAGLPINPPLKPSGLDWLGDLPEHWEVKPLKWFFRLIYRYPTYFDIQYVDEGIPEIRGEALVDGEIIALEDQRFISPETNTRFPKTILDVGDIVMSVRGTMGKIGVVRPNFKGGNITANLLRLSPDQRQATPEFLSWLFRSGFFAQILDRVSPQTTIQTITMPQLTALELPRPPLPEQRAIAAYLDAETSMLDALVAKVETAVERLQEYRTALITAAVTGKIDVRAHSKGNTLAV